MVFNQLKDGETEGIRSDKSEGARTPSVAEQVLIRLGYGTGALVDTATMQMMRDVDNAWKFITGRRRQRPVGLEEVIEQMAVSRFEDRELTFFSPWGPRYKIKDPEIGGSSPEMATIRELREIFEAMVGFGLKPKLLLMPADAYGIEINNLSPNFVLQYFNSLARMVVGELGDLINVEITPWSAIREENMDLYRQLSERRADELNEKYALLLRTAMRTARVLNPQNERGQCKKVCS